MRSSPGRLAAMVLVLLVPPGSAAEAVRSGGTTPGEPAGKIFLDHAVIVAAEDQPRFVRRRIEDLAEYLGGIARSTIPVVTSAPSGDGTIIAIGELAAGAVLAGKPSRDELGDEGFRIESSRIDGRTWIAVAGATPAGTKFGIARLMRMVKADGGRPWLEGPLGVVERPAFALRGMHLNGWPIGYPHGFRAWREEDWKRYLDLLTFEGVNLFLLWPFMEILPVPLSKEDQEYLEECRRVVDHARNEQGMEVWILQCTNRVARDDCGVRDPRRRHYWRPSQEDLDPGNPDQLRAILRSREEMYRIIDNVDGVCNIDSDPGYREGSPLRDYLKVLRGCREALDRRNIHGKEAKLVHWMWMGWGHRGGKSFDLSLQDETLRLLREELPEPWGLVAGVPAFLPLLKARGLLSRTVFLPYGTIEAEPSYPATNVAIGGIRKSLGIAFPLSRELAGVMGNVQTPLLQFPHAHAYLGALVDPGNADRPDREILLETAELLHPESAGTIADAWLALAGTDAAALEAARTKLGASLGEGRLGRPGALGGKLFPQPRIAAEILLAQVTLRAARERLLDAPPGALPPAEAERLVKDFLEAFLSWEIGNGWQSLWGWGPPWGLLGDLAADPRFSGAMVGLRKSLGDDAAVEAAFGRIADALVARHGERAVREGCIAPLKGAVLAARKISTLAQEARASASAVPDPKRYPPSAAVDGYLGTLYWPGALVRKNEEWLELAWDGPRTFRTVTVSFLKHPSMVGRTIRLQRRAGAGWEDFATTTVPDPGAGPHAVATFALPAPVTLEALRIVNLLDLFEVEVEGGA